MFDNTVAMEPYTDEQYAVILVSGANTDFQLWRAPYASPVGKGGYIKELAITNTIGAAAEVRFFDADLSNTAVPARGSGSYAGCLAVVGVPLTGTSGVGLTTVVIENIPSDFFQGGIALQCNQAGAKIMATIGVR